MAQSAPALLVTVFLAVLAGLVKTVALDPQYERCMPLLDARGVRDACGHPMNPSAISFLPTSRRLVVGGHEYLIHATEGPDGAFNVDGCYYGEDRTLGRGDIEGLASLDFSLSKPSPTTDPTGRLATNWAKLKALEGYVLAAEENYSFRGIYLVDSTRLGSGLVQSTEATVAKFELPVYLRNLEALAFVPDVTDDDYLGIVVMGSQSKAIKACRIPLGNPSKPVICESETGRYSGGSVDSMEYDPTFEVMPGVYGGLIIGTDPADHAVYVDPWALALRGEVVRWSEEFEMRDGRVGDVPMIGREGHAIHGDKVFYAVDENSRASGAVVCHMGNKPRSTATSVNGWHPTNAGDPTAVLDVDSTKLIRGFDFDRPALMSTTQPLRPLGEVTSEYVMARWPAYALNGDGECGSVCREEKDVMCMLYPELCAHLRCQEFRRGTYSLDMGSVCEGEDPVTGEQLGSPSAVLQLGLTDKDVITYWRKENSMTGDECGPACRESKERVCSAFPELCEQLRCEDVRAGLDGGRSVESCGGVAEPEEPAELLPIPLVDSQMARRWSNHTSGARDPRVCGSKCRQDKWQMCVGNPEQCWKLRCSDIRSGLLLPVLDCRGGPSARIANTPSAPSPRSIAVEDGVCYWGDCGGDGARNTIRWCQASLGNCVVGCGATWCPNSPDYQPVNPIESSDHGLDSSASIPDTDTIIDIPAGTSEQNPVAAALAAIRAEEEQREAVPTSRPTPPPASLAQFAPTRLPNPQPTAPLVGYCSWFNCNGEAQGPQWCRESADNCVYTCGGSWCWAGEAAAESHEVTMSAIPQPRPPSSETSSGVKFNSVFNYLPGKDFGSQSTRGSWPDLDYATAEQNEQELRPEAAPGGGAGHSGKRDSGDAEVPLKLDIDALASNFGLDDNSLALLVHILAGIEDATQDLELTRSRAAEPNGKK